MKNREMIDNSIHNLKLSRQKLICEGELLKIEVGDEVVEVLQEAIKLIEEKILDLYDERVTL